MELTSKLQLKPDQGIETLLVPESLSTTLASLTATSTSRAPGLLVFVIDSATLEKLRHRIADGVMQDRLTWVAYPKAGQLGTDLNRDTLAASLGTSGLQPVRQIAIDDVWSALRFRPGARPLTN